MSNEYLPLAKLIEQGLQEGTVLECSYASIRYEWHNNKIGNKEWNPFEYEWRIVSTPPKKITFEASPFLIQRGEKYAQVLEVPVDGPWMHELNCEQDYIVTVEEKR